ALGASPTRLIRQFATEGALLVIASSVPGILLARASMQILKGMISQNVLDYMPYLQALGLSFQVWEFAAILSMGAVVLFSITPMLRMPFRQLREGLSEGGRGYAGTLWRRFGANLVVVELALAVVLLVSAGLLGKSLYRLLHVDIGFQPDHLATLSVALSDADYPKEQQQVAAEKQITDRIANLPGVESVGVTSMLPVSHNGNTVWVRFVGRAYNGEHNEVNRREVNPSLFTTLRAK